MSPSDNATAFTIGRTLLSNVTPHVYNRYFVCIDIQDFFPSIEYGRVRTLFETIGYRELAAHALTSLSVCVDGLPQGGVTSPAISNLVCSKLDRRLAGMASRRNITYTRYADDMTLSSNNRNALNKGIDLALDIVSSEGFTPHPDKLRVMGPRIHCRVTGLVKNSSEPRFGIGRKKKRQVRAAMHRIATGRIADFKYSTTTAIEGWLAYLHSVDQPSYQQMATYWSLLKDRYDVGD